MLYCAVKKLLYLKISAVERAFPECLWNSKLKTVMNDWMSICVYVHTHHFNGRDNVLEDKIKGSEEH